MDDALCLPQPFFIIREPITCKDNGPLLFNFQKFTFQDFISAFPYYEIPTYIHNTTSSWIGKGRLCCRWSASAQSFTFILGLQTLTYPQSKLNVKTRRLFVYTSIKLFSWPTPITLPEYRYSQIYCISARWVRR
jgi:hypothetical protein